MEKLRAHIEHTHGGMDILVNAAGIFYTSTTLPMDQQARELFRTNFFGTVTVCESLWPLLRDGSRVVNVGSLTGALSLVPDQQFQQDLLSPALTLEELKLYMSSFMDQDLITLYPTESSYLFHMYSLSKLGVHILSRVLQRRLPPRSKINTVCPWWCKKAQVITGVPLASGSIISQVDEIGEMICHLATLSPESTVNGVFVSNEGESECFEKLIHFLRTGREVENE